MVSINAVFLSKLCPKRTTSFYFVRNYTLSCGERAPSSPRHDKFHSQVSDRRDALKFSVFTNGFTYRENKLCRGDAETTTRRSRMFECAKPTSCFVRMSSQNANQGSDKHPPLMEFPELVWPNVPNTMRNWIMRNMIIRPYFDQEFDINDFTLGSKQAVETVSRFLANGEFQSLQGLVHEQAIEKLKRSIELFSVKQRQDIATSQEDIYFSFPYQIGIMFNDDDSNHQRFVEITMVHHVVRDLHALVRSHGVSPFNVGFLPEFNDKFYICNYRFIKEFTKGVESSWVINVLNHFKPPFYDADFSVKKN